MEAKDLLKHVKYVQKAIERGGVLPILDSILFADGKLTTSCLNITASVETGIKGEFLVDAKQLVKILSVLNGNVTIKKDIGSTGKILITDGKKKYLLGINFNVGEFPKTPPVGKKVMTLGLADIKNITKAAEFCGRDQFRPVMSGACIDNDSIVATDAHVMCFIPLSKPTKKSPYIIPSKVINLIKDFNEAKVMTKDKTRYTFVNGIYSVSFRVIEGNYPNWKVSVPKKFKATSIIDKSEILSVIKSAEPCLNNLTHQIEIKSKKEGLLFTAFNDYVGDRFEELVDCKNKGDMYFGCNAKYLKILVSNIDSDKIKMCFVAPNEAIIFNDYFLMMPVILNN